MTTLEAAVAHYQAMLLALRISVADDTTTQLLTVLLARDALARVLADTAELPAELFATIAALDQDLRTNVAQLGQAVRPTTLVRWRETRQPAPSAWWWQLEACVAPPAAEVGLEGKTKAEALRLAQQEVRQQYTNFRYWAGFVLSGDGGPARVVPPSGVERIWRQVGQTCLSRPWQASIWSCFALVVIMLLYLRLAPSKKVKLISYTSRSLIF